MLPLLCQNNPDDTGRVRREECRSLLGRNYLTIHSLLLLLLFSFVVAARYKVAQNVFTVGTDKIERTKAMFKFSHNISM